jgi:hypothetical protein
MCSQEPDSDQIARFRQAAKDAETDTSADALDRVFGKLDVKRKPDAGGVKDKTKRDG